MRRIDRREFLKGTLASAAAAGAGGLLRPAGASARAGVKMIVIGFDGMDPRLCESMIAKGELPNLGRLREQGGYRVLGTTIPPQSPVAWASFINGADPGSHGIFDFVHRDPAQQAMPFFSAAETVPGEGYVAVGDHRIPLDFWPFDHRPARTVLRRAGTPFWHYLDAAGVESTFYDLPSNYPPSRSEFGHHRCLSGMGVTDLRGSYGTYMHFAEDGPAEPVDKGGGILARIVFDGDSAAPVKLLGPKNTLLAKPADTAVELTIHRDRRARAAVIEVAGRQLVLGVGEWSPWIPLDFGLAMPSFLPDKKVRGICRFYLQEVWPNFRLYASPVNVDPSDPAVPISEPGDFCQRISDRLGLFYTTGFQEDHKALSHGTFRDEEFALQADYVLSERERLLSYALDRWESGLLFFYFSSTDLQSHMFWWDTDEKHPLRTPEKARECFGHVKRLYARMDAIVGDLLRRFGDRAQIVVMSDHGFSNFRRQFGLNGWLRDNGYLGPADCTSILSDTDWRETRAFGLGINGLYLNLRGREKLGIVEPGSERDQLLDELAARLEAVRDEDGQPVIRKVHRSDKVYRGKALAYAPDLILGYSRGFRASWKTCLGDVGEAVLLDNDSAWSADHCMDASEVPGVLFSNRPIRADRPSLVDLGPSILAAWGLPVPGSMQGKNIF